MKKHILFAFFGMIISGILYSQYSNIIVFSEQGERFYLIIDGIKYNEEPETNVKATDLYKEKCIITVVFEDKKLTSANRSLRILPRGNEFTLCVKKKKKSKYVINKTSSTPIIQGIPSYLVTHSANTPKPEPEIIITETTTTTTTTGGENPEGVSLGVNVNEPNVDVNLDVNIGTNNGGGGTITETTTTTTTTVVKPVNDFVPGYKGRLCCLVPIPEDEFQKARTAIAAHQHADKQMETAEMYLNSACLTVGQTLSIMGLFTFDYTKMKFAKFAYLRVYDINNFDKVVNKLENTNYRDELNNFILQNPK